MYTAIQAHINVLHCQKRQNGALLPISYSAWLIGLPVSLRLLSSSAMQVKHNRGFMCCMHLKSLGYVQLISSILG